MPSVISSMRAQLVGKATARGRVTSLEQFTYTANFMKAPVISVSKVTTNFQADSDFLMLYILGGMIAVTDMVPNVGVIINPDYAQINLRDTTTNRNLFNRPINASLVSGFGGNPYIMQESKLVYAKTQLETTVTLPFPLVAPNGYLFQFGFAGLKVYYAGEYNA